MLRPEFTPALAQPGSTPSRPVPAAVRLKTRIARRQKVLRRRYVSLRVACSANCSMRVVSKTAIRRRKAVRLRDVKRRTVRKARTVKVPVAKRARRTIRKALRAKRKVTIRLTVRVRGANGPPGREAPEHPDRGLGRATGAPYGTPVRWFVCGRRAGSCPRPGPDYRLNRNLLA